MPNYVFRCPAGHEAELIRPRDVEVVPCPCGEPASRQSVYAVNFGGFTRTPVDQRMIKMGAFNEASAELEYQHSRQTNVDGSLKPEPPLWQTAKAEAKRLQKLGVKDSLDVRHG